MAGRKPGIEQDARIVLVAIRHFIDGRFGQVAQATVDHAADVIRYAGDRLQ